MNSVHVIPIENSAKPFQISRTKLQNVLFVSYIIVYQMTVISEKLSKDASLGLSETLSDLDSYYEAQMKASAEFKAAMMNLLKARRHKGRGSICANPYSSNDVREELVAQTRLQVEWIGLEPSNQCRTVDVIPVKVPELIDEFDDVKEILPIRFQLLTRKDLMSNSKDSTYPKTNAEEEGLRQRRRVADDLNHSDIRNQSKAKGEWIIDDNEQRLLDSNPIDLFGGFPPLPLRQAQQQAQDALKHYVNAAQLASSILHRVNSTYINDHKLEGLEEEVNE